MATTTSRTATADGPPAEVGGSRRSRRRERRNRENATQLSSTKERTSNVFWTPTVQEFEAEVSARKLSLPAFAAPALPPPPTSSRVNVVDGGESSDRMRETRENQLTLEMSMPPPEVLQAHDYEQSRAAIEVDDGVGYAEEASDITGSVELKETKSGEFGLWASRGMLAGAAALYGTNFGCVKLLEESVPMSLAAALRFTVAVVPFLPFLRKIKPGVVRGGFEVRRVHYRHKDQQL